LNGDSRSCFASLLGEQSANYLEASPLAVDFGAAFPLVNAGVYTVLQNSVGIAPVGPTLPKAGQPTTRGRFASRPFPFRAACH
jgi:hypothetical protein